MRNKKNFLPIAIIFLITLQAYYFRTINLAPFPFIGFLLILIILPKRNISLREIRDVFPYVIIIFFSTVIGVINLYEINGAKYYFPTLFGWLLMPVSFVYFKRFSLKYINEMSRIITIIIFLHITFFYLQFISFHIIGVKLDFIELITGEEQRIGATKLKGFGSSNIRAAGLFTEPGSYSVYIYMLLGILLKLKKRFGLIEVLGLLSMLLSFSLTGILMAMAIISYYLSSISLSKKMILNIFLFLLSLSVFFYFTADIFLGPIYTRLLNIEDDSSAAARFNSGIEIFKSRGFLLMGLGIGIRDESIKATSVILGALFNLGLINLIAYIVVSIIKIYNANKNLKVIFLLIPVFLSNISLNQFIFVFFLGIMSSKIKDLGVSTI